MISYHSTRGGAPALGFEDAVLAGLASDGGLYVPDSLPQFSATELKSWRDLPYAQLACRVLAPFTEGTLSAAELQQLAEETYAEFRHPDVAPLAELGSNHYALELFHGPTLAFKDFALQFLGRLLGKILHRRGIKATVLGATSGDTGSAAIAGFTHCADARIFILHPYQRTSDVQRRQMTTVLDPRVYNLAVRGTFDDCQNIVKTLFSDSAFRAQQQLIAVNSINWARILVQTVYYFYAALKLGAPEQRVSFCVPTGNFGDIFAGYLAKKMGLPVERLIIATNSNDILARTLATGEYHMSGVAPTLSPSMDIQISSNFERLLFDLHGRGGAKIRALMEQLRTQGRFALEPAALAALRAEFAAHTVDDAATLATITQIWNTKQYLLDPHTAVGAASAHAMMGDAPDHPVITLATAHPAKFPDAVKKATGITPPLPDFLHDLFDREERFAVVENDAGRIKNIIQSY